MHHSEDLIRIFNACFAFEYNTRLVRGEDEPIYLPAHVSCAYHAIFFAHGFFSSALHECAHWLLAGETRRQQVDYGYWYMPDGRTLEQQALFQQVEIKPQALEWVLSMAAGFPFQVSVDNLNGAPVDRGLFTQAVWTQVLHYQDEGLPPRAHFFHEALHAFYDKK